MITTEQQLSVLSAEVLRDLGRNEAAGRAVRKIAIKFLIEKKHPFANHPDFRELRAEIAEETEAHAEVESLINQVEEPKALQGTDEELQMQCEETKEEPLIQRDEIPGPFRASFTTKNL